MKRPSPSQQLSYLLCPGYMPDDVSGEAAERGTELHYAAEKRDPLIIEDPNDRQLVELCLLHVDMHIENLVRNDPERWRTRDPKHVRRYVEKKLPPPPGSNEGGGTIDLLVLPRTGPYKIAAVVDYKFGYKPVVPVSDNPQMIAYAMRVFAAYKKIERVDVSVLLPALRAASHHTFTREEAEQKYHALGVQVDAAVEAADDPDEYCPGTACTYCKRKRLGCPALTLPFLQVVKQENNIPIPTEVWDLANADENGLSKYRTLAAMMADFADTIKKSVDSEVDVRGLDALPGYRRIRRRSHMVVYDPARAIVECMDKKHKQLSYLAPLVFQKSTMVVDKFIETSMKLLYILGISPTDNPKDWDKVCEFPQIFKGLQEEKSGASYLAKAPRRGYVEMLEDVMEKELLSAMASSTENTEDTDATEDTETSDTNS